MHLRRRNCEHARIKRNNRKFKTAETFCSIFGTYFKIFAIWALVMMLDFFIDFRFEFLWSCWLFVCTVSDSFRYEGLAFALFFSLIAVTSDLFCYFLVPTSLVYLLGSSFVWIQLVWQAGGGSSGALTAVGDRGVYGLTVALCFLFVYVEIAVRLRDPKTLSLGIDLCRPFAAHCIGYPVVTLGFSLKSMILHQFRTRRQRSVGAQNMTYFTLLDEARLLKDGKDYETVASDDTEKPKRSGCVENCQVAALPSAARGTNTGQANHVVSPTTGKERHRKSTSQQHATHNHHHHHHHSQHQHQNTSKSDGSPGGTGRSGGASGVTYSLVESGAGGGDDLLSAGQLDELSSEVRQQRSTGVHNPVCEANQTRTTTASYLPVSSPTNNGNCTGVKSNPSLSATTALLPTSPPSSSPCATSSCVGGTSWTSTLTGTELPCLPITASSLSLSSSAFVEDAYGCSPTSLTSPDNSKVKSTTGKAITSSAGTNTGGNSTQTAAGAPSSAPGSGGSQKIASSSGGKHASKDEYTLKLETDVRSLKSELQSLRTLEMDLRDQVQQLTLAERAYRAELSQARQESESLQTKLRQLTDRLQTDKTSIQAAEKRLAEEQKQRTSLEQRLLQLQQQQQQQQQQQNIRQSTSLRNKHGTTGSLSTPGNQAESAALAVDVKSSGAGHGRVSRGTLTATPPDDPVEKTCHRGNNGGGGGDGNRNNNSSPVAGFCGDSSCASRVKQLQSELDSLTAAGGADTVPVASSKKANTSAKESSRSRTTSSGTVLTNGEHPVGGVTRDGQSTHMAVDPVTSELSYRLACLQEENQRLTNTLKNEDQMKQELLTVYHSSLKEITDLNAKLTNKEFHIVELNMRLDELTPRMCDYVNRLNSSSAYAPLASTDLSSSASSPSPLSSSNSSSTTTAATFCAPIKSDSCGLADNSFFSPPLLPLASQTLSNQPVQLTVSESALLSGVGEDLVHHHPLTHSHHHHHHTKHLVLSGPSQLEEQTAHAGNGFRLTAPPGGGVLSLIASTVASPTLGSAPPSTQLVGSSASALDYLQFRLMNGTSTGLGKTDQHRPGHAGLHSFFPGKSTGVRQGNQHSHNHHHHQHHQHQQRTFSSSSSASPSSTATLSPASSSSLTASALAVAAETFHYPSRQSANFHSGLSGLQHDLVVGSKLTGGNGNPNQFCGDSHRRHQQHQAPGSYSSPSTNSSTTTTNNNNNAGNSMLRNKGVGVPTGSVQVNHYPAYHHQLQFQASNQLPVSPSSLLTGDLVTSSSSLPLESSLHLPVSSSKLSRLFPIGYSSLTAANTTPTPSPTSTSAADTTHTFDISSGSGNMADSVFSAAATTSGWESAGLVSPTPVSGGLAGGLPSSSNNNSTTTTNNNKNGGGGTSHAGDELQVSKAGHAPSGVDCCQPHDGADVRSEAPSVSQSEAG